MKTSGLKKGLFGSRLTMISIFALGYISYAAGNKGNLQCPSITIIQNNGNSFLACAHPKNEDVNVLEIDRNFVSSSPAIVVYTGFPGFEVPLDDGSTALVHNPKNSNFRTTRCDMVKIFGVSKTV